MRKVTPLVLFEDLIADVSKIYTPLMPPLLGSTVKIGLDVRTVQEQIF
jgi:hypothetical protein